MGAGLTRDEELWGVALVVLARHGPGAGAHAAERLAAAEAAGAEDGAAL